MTAAHSFSSFVGMGSSSHDFTGVLRTSDSISSEVVSASVVSPVDDCSGNGTTSVQRPLRMESILETKNWLKSNARDLLHAFVGSGVDCLRFKSRLATRNIFLESLPQSSIVWW